MQHENSFTKISGLNYQWILPSYDNDKVHDLSAFYNFSIPLMQTLVNRGLDSKEVLDLFLFTNEQLVGDPSLLKDADKAVDRIISAIKNKEKILVAGDYDVDGITSTSMMMLCLIPLGAQVNYFLPHRVRDGYGLSSKIVGRAADNGYTVIITVDNGITANEPAKLAKERNVDLIITDHHRPQDPLPDAFAIVDPVQQDCLYPFKLLAGVGVAFKILSLLYKKLNKPLPQKAYELLLMGTVADVVPLLGENRYWVRHCLQRLDDHQSYSFSALKNNVKLAEKPISSLDIAFSIAPQLNALGRLEDPRKGVHFLIGAKRADVDHVAQVLHELNEARKDVERVILNEIEQVIDSGQINLEKENIIVAASKKWPPGVIGLVASRLMSAYGKPTLLFHLTKDGKAKGSARSIPAFDLFSALQECSELLDHFGGHACAAGLSLKVENLPLLKDKLEKKILEKLTPEDLEPKIELDALLQLGDLKGKFMDDMRLMEPFGSMNNAPVFYIPDVTLVDEPILLKDQHVKCKIFSQGTIKPVIFFSRPELFKTFLELKDDSFDLAATVMENYWQGTRSIELKGVDVAIKGAK
jgi:single-stranded-DNA-specific exonuclease